MYPYELYISLYKFQGIFHNLVSPYWYVGDMSCMYPTYYSNLSVKRINSILSVRIMANGQSERMNSLNWSKVGNIINTRNLQQFHNLRYYKIICTLNIRTQLFNYQLYNYNCLKQLFREGIYSYIVLLKISLSPWKE